MDRTIYLADEKMSKFIEEMYDDEFNMCDLVFRPTKNGGWNLEIHPNKQDFSGKHYITVYEPETFNTTLVL